MLNDNQKGFINIIPLIVILALVGTGAYFVSTRQATPSAQSPIPSPTPTPTPTPIACTQEARQCPDGSYVSRTGKNCEFAKCPTIKPPSNFECTKDSDCPSTKYSCQGIQGVGTACPSSDSSCVPTYTVIKGECKLKEGSRCSVNSDCAAGNLCHKNICVSPILGQCSGPSDNSCPSDYECVQSCGSPVVRNPDSTPPSYYCQLKGYVQVCPICLAINTLIDTPSGVIPVQQLQKGMSVWTVNKSGNRISAIVSKTSKVPVPSTHKMVHLILSDGRQLFVSPGHPTVDGRTVGDLVAYDVYDGSKVVSSERISYGESATYDILPTGETGFYFANGILMGSTLR